jgi:hypothetical protein
MFRCCHADPAAVDLQLARSSGARSRQFIPRGELVWAPSCGDFRLCAGHDLHVRRCRFGLRVLDESYSSIYRGIPNGTTIGRATNNGRSVNPNFIRHLPFGVAGIAVDAHRIYFTSLGNGGIVEADLNGKHVRLNVFHGAAPGGGALTVAGQFIYWTHVDGIGRANLNGTNIRTNFIKINQSAGATVSTDSVAVAAGQFVFWDESGTDGGGGTSREPPSTAAVRRTRSSESLTTRTAWPSSEDTSTGPTLTPGVPEPPVHTPPSLARRRSGARSLVEAR